MLQLYWPETFAFRISDQLMQSGSAYLEGMSITRPDGVTLLRPTGLTDTPGGAAISGMFVLVMGAAFAMSAKRLLVRVLVLFLMVNGAVCVFVCQVRSVLTVTVLCLVLMVIVLLLRREAARANKVMAGLGVILLAGFVSAASAGGSSVQERLSTLFEGSPAQVYYKNRGVFLERTFFETLPEYPLGAGLGRWGMMNRYFADQAAAPDLYAEVQWTGWAYDGGAPLVAVNGVLLLGALMFAWRLATKSDEPEAIWAVAVLVLNCGLVALSFGAPVFASQLGIDFWLLNGLLTVLASPALTEREGEAKWNWSSSPRTSSGLAGWTGRTSP
jgi:hypothetical protein